MGNVTSRPDEAAALYLRDQTRCEFKTKSKDLLNHADRIICAVSISSLIVTNSRKRILLNVVPNAFPATKVAATRDVGDNNVIEYVQVCPLVPSVLFSERIVRTHFVPSGSRSITLLYFTELYSEAQQ
jgi:hypothetical protein